MRIEYHGTVLVEPPFQHTGYLSAAIESSYAPMGASPLTAGLLAAAALLFAVSLLAARKGRTVRRGLVAVVVALAGAACALAGAREAVQGRPALAPAFVQTLANLEAACAATEAWSSEHGQLPTTAEWANLAKGQPWATDGWGYPMAYHRLGEAGFDGQRYEVVSIVERTGVKAPTSSDRLLWDIPSWWLGRDGIYGTRDDDRHILAGVDRRVNLHRRGLPHGREPRG